MNRPHFRARNLDPSKRIRLLVDQHDDNNNTLTNSSTTRSSSSNNLLVSLSSTSNLQTSHPSTVSNSQTPQRCVPEMPFVSGMEREEETVYIHIYTFTFVDRDLFFILFRNIIYKMLSMLNDDLARQKFVLYLFQIYTKILVVNRSILQ